MKVLLLSNEYPPHIYGGAGVHVEYLTRELSRLMPVEVRCFGEQKVAANNLTVRGFNADKNGFTCPKQLENVFTSSNRAIAMNAAGIDADIVHCHTWYTHLAGIFAKLNYGIPLVITVHSLEPLRPWKREQIGGGYDFSCWVERTALEMADAVIAVSRGTRDDILRHFKVPAEKIHTIYNGIDPVEFKQVQSTALLERYGIDKTKPYLLFVGRITRQKGIVYLVNAIRYMDPDYQIVLCAGSPDTPEIAKEMEVATRAVQAERPGVFWINEQLPKSELIELYSHASVFCCPSIYEPFGIINLEAMACRTPVVGSAIGGIPEIIVHGETGTLVPLAQIQESPFTPIDPDIFSRDLASAVNRLMKNPEMRKRYGDAGRMRASDVFSWTSIARQTKGLYESILSRKK